MCRDTYKKGNIKLFKISHWSRACHVHGKLPCNIIAESTNALVIVCSIDKQKALRRDCIYNIEHRSRNRGFRHLL